MKKRSFNSVIFILITVLLLTSCPSEEAPQPITHNLYKMVDSNNNTFYFIGTMHVGSSRFHLMDTTTATALNTADHLVLEILLDFASRIAGASASVDESQKTTNKLGTGVSYATYKLPGETVALLTTEEVAELDDFIKEAEISLESDIFDLSSDDNPREPALLSSYLESILVIGLTSLRSGYAMDTYLFTQFGGDASIAKMLSLETYPEASTKLFEVNIADQMKGLKTATETLVSGDASLVKEMAENYISQNTAYFDTMAKQIKIDQPSFYQNMLVDRNTAWKTKIKTWSTDNSNKQYFVGVGILHLVGEDSLLKLLRDEGFTIDEVVR